MKQSYNKILKKLGLTLVKENNHLKCQDKDGNIYILSQQYLKHANENKRFAKLTNKFIWLKNKHDIEMFVNHLERKTNVTVS